MADAEQPSPTERQKGETAPAFEAFRSYLMMGGGRSTAKVARQLGKSKTLIDRWSSRNDWVERVRAFESSIAREVDDEQRDRLAERARRQAQIAQAHQEASAFVANAVVTRIADARQRGEDPFKGMDMRELLTVEATLARAHHRSVVTERLALGMTTDQPGAAMPADQAREQAAKLSDDELDDRLGVVDELAPRREARAAQAS